MDQVTRHSGFILAGLAIVILFFVVAPISADVHIINPGDPLQTAVNSADDGDTILLNPGTPYYQHDIAITKNITIGANTAGGGNPSNTIIDAQNNGRIFTVSGGKNLIIDNLTLRNGRAPDGAVSDRFDHTGFAGGSGGTISSDGKVTVTSSNIHDCRAGNGGAGYDGSDGMFDPGTGGGDGGNGGAIFTSDEAIIDATIISRCYAGNGGNAGRDYAGTGAAGGGGGAIYVMNFLTITSSSITDCTAGDAGSSPADGGAGGDGGGIYTANSTPITDYNYLDLQFTTITNCSAGKAGDGSSYNDGGNGGSGGGVYSTYPATTITSSTITGCKATPKGAVHIGSSAAVDGRGGGYGGWGFGGGLTMENSTLTGNWAPVGGGIGMDDGSSGDIMVTSSNISSNTATTWGAVYYHGTFIATSSTFIGNSGGAIQSYSGTLHMNRIYNNAGTTVYTQYGMIDAANNWWGTNSDPTGYTSGDVTSTPWLVLGTTTTPPSITTVQTSEVRANLTFTNTGTDTSSQGHVPDGIPVAFAHTGIGAISLASGVTATGANATTFAPSPTIPGTATIDMTVDGQVISVVFDVPLPPPPEVTEISPASGPVIGGTMVVITGTDFTGATDVMFGATAATSFTVDKTPQITAISPAHSAATTDITVTTPGGTSSISSDDEFTFYYPVPAINGINPSAGPMAGGTSVTITGTGYTGTTDVWFGATAATGFTEDSDTQITATSPAGTGTVDITVTTAGGTSPVSSDDEFFFATVPAVTSISPVEGPVAGGTSVIITGSGFTDAIGVRFGVDAAGSYTVNSDSQITATSPAGTGTVDITVTTAGGTSPASSSDVFRFAPVPSITSLSPSSGGTAGGTSVTISGSGFTNATSVRFGTVTATGFTVNTDSQITATSPPQAQNIVDITVTTAGGTSPAVPTDEFEYIASVPGVSGLAPDAGPVTGGITVIITGSGFTAATAVTFDTAAATDYTVDSDTQITATSPAHAAGTVDVTVTTAGGTSPASSDSRFTFANIPAVLGIFPAVGPVAGSTTVVITGAEFTHASAVRFGATAATGFTVDSDTQITTTSPAHAAGTVDVTVTTPGGTTGISPYDEFRFVPIPAVTGITPASGINNGTINITNLAGSDFWTTGTTNVFLNRTGHMDIMVTDVTVVDTTNITCTFDLAGQATGLWNVVVINPDKQENMLVNGFRIRLPVEPTNAPDTSGNDDGNTVSATTTTLAKTLPLMTVTVNIGGDSKAWQATVTGTKLSELIITGTVQSSTGPNQSAPSGTVYQYIRFIPARYTSITKAVINFSVPQSWLDEKHIAPGSIVLYHQTANGWEALPTTVLFTKDGTVSFSAQSIGFSLFAIVGTPAGTAPVSAALTQVSSGSLIQERATAHATTTRVVVTTKTNAPPAPAGSAGFPFMTVALIGAGCAVLIGSGWYVRRWWIRRQNPALFRDYD